MRQRIKEMADRIRSGRHVLWLLRDVGLVRKYNLQEELPEELKEMKELYEIKAEKKVFIRNHRYRVVGSMNGYRCISISIHLLLLFCLFVFYAI